MPETNQIAQLNEILNDLVIINFQHVKALKKAILQLENADHDLIPVLDEMVVECRHHINNLRSLDFSKGKEGLVTDSGYNPDEHALSHAGVIGSQWNADFQSLTHRQRSQIITHCINITHASSLAYETALSNANIQNANPLIQRDLNIQLSNFKKYFRRLKILK